MKVVGEPRRVPLKNMLQVVDLRPSKIRQPRLGVEERDLLKLGIAPRRRLDGHHRSELVAQRRSRMRRSTEDDPDVSVFPAKFPANHSEEGQIVRERLD